MEIEIEMDRRREREKRRYIERECVREKKRRERE